MALYSSIIIILFSIIMSRVIYKDLLSPSILIKIPWLLSLVLLTLSEFEFDSNSLYYLYFAIGLIIFDIAYLISSRGKRRKFHKFDNITLTFNEKLIYFIIIIEVIVILLYVISVIFFVRANYTYNFYFTLKLGSVNGTFSPPMLMGYIINFIIAFTSLVVYLASTTMSFKKKYLIIQIGVGITSVFLTLGRTSIVLFAILNISLFLIINNVENKKIFKNGIILLLLGSAIFGGYNLLKYPYKIEQSNNIFRLAFESIIGYLTGGVVAFQKWAETNVELVYGLNIFRFFIAVLNRIGYDLQLQNLVNPYISIGSNSITNVYTMYYFYCMDFGLLFGLIMQFFIGLLHGLLYRKLLTNKPFWIYLFSLSLYPLMMQFFQDQYISLMSTWIQFLIYGLLFYKTNIFIKYKVTSIKRNEEGMKL